MSFEIMKGAFDDSFEDLEWSRVSDSPFRNSDLRNSRQIHPSSLQMFKHMDGDVGDLDVCVCTHVSAFRRERRATLM